MTTNQHLQALTELAAGRTDRVIDLLAADFAPTATDNDGVSLIQHCAYYGDVTALKLLLARGENLNHLGDNLGLNTAAFHGHWRLCQFLLERGAGPNLPDPDTGETPLHSALSKVDPERTDRVLQVLLAHGANPNVATTPGIETGAFMRDVRTRGETPLHRAAAFGGAVTIQLLLDARAQIDARDANGDSPLSWASWYLRPDNILRLLCFGPHRIRTDRQSMRANLLGQP